MPKLTHGSPSFFIRPHKFGIDIVEWSMLNANVLFFQCVFTLSNYSANCLRLGTKNGANFGFFGPVRFRGHFEKISRHIAKVLLVIYVVWESFVDVGFSTSEKVWRERKRNAPQIMIFIRSM